MNSPKEALNRSNSVPFVLRYRSTNGLRTGGYTAFALRYLGANGLVRCFPNTTVVFLAALLVAAPAPAAEPAVKPFVTGSLKQITTARAGKPFVLGLWSLTCAHCQEELALLGEVRRKYPRLDLVLISTDSPQEAAELRATLARHGLGDVESWVFADEFAERLRFDLDRQWRGELPRTYFYATDGTRRAVSGRLDPAELERLARKP